MLFLFYVVMFKTFMVLYDALFEVNCWRELVVVDSIVNMQ